MRIIGGGHRGRRLVAIKGRAIRPTSDRIREALFNIIGNRVLDAKVLDLYAGTGAFGIEALSRGAAQAVFIDRSVAALDIIKKNVAACRLEANCRIIKSNATGNLNLIPMGDRPFDLMFMDPPYNQGYLEPGMRALKNFKPVSRRTLLIVEHSPNEAVPEEIAPLSLVDQRRYGKTLVSFFTYML